ncbi:MAG: hypothetical protein EOM15_16950 [Spirochaetia bacterium]|nr:hypothetical protein [Spirochaetia bacterium]
MITCYYLQRQKRESLCLSPYLDVENANRLEEDEQVMLKASGMLTKNQRDEVSYSLYSAIDFSVDRWIQNKQYVPRLLISALVFTVSYFILSLAIRDPLPMVDELLISGGLAVFTWISLAKRDTRSSVAQRRRTALKIKSSEREEVIEEELFALEQYLDDLHNADALELCHSLCLVSTLPLKPLSYEGSSEVTKALAHLLDLHLRVRDKALHRTVLKIVQQRRQRKSDFRLAQHLFHLQMQQKLDLPLLAFSVLLLES